jgi:trimeric autotransporter adhesin
MKLRACFVAVTFLSAIVVSTLAQTAAPNSSPASTQVPRLIKFSGVAQDEAHTSLTGVVGVTFSLYKDQQGGSPLWVETQNVRVDETGHYTVMLGSGSADGVPLSLFSSAEAHWISTQISGQPEQSRILLLSVPYALKAADAETLGGLPASAFMHANAGGAQGKSSSSAASSTQANLPPAGVTGKGTKDFVPMWTGATALGNSLIYQTGGNLGIGTKTPQAEVDVVGTGVRGIQATVPGTQAAISGIATAVKGGTTGVYGQSSDPGGNAMLGVNNATTGATE